MPNFTDRYIELPITVYNKRHKDLTGEELLEGITMKVLPFEISEYYQSDEDEDKATQIHLKNGSSYLIELPVNEFERLLNSQ